MDAMDDGRSIPMMKHPSNVMEVGPNGNNLASNAVAKHPIDQMQRANRSGASVGGRFVDLDGVTRLYGSGLAMRLATERRMASQVGGRLPGLDAASTSNVMLETVLGEDTKLDFGDYLGKPEFSVVASTNNPHGVMEQRLGL